MAASFEETIKTIQSPNAFALRAAAGAWMTLAGAATQGSDRMKDVASGTAATEGVGLPQLADRISSVSSWSDGSASLAMAVSRQLQAAGDAATKAAERADSLKAEYEEAAGANVEPGTSAYQPPVNKGLTDGFAERKAQLTEEAKKELDHLSSVFATVVGGEVPGAPDVGAAEGGDPAGRAIPEGSGTHGPPMSGGGEMTPVANGATVGSGSYPYSMVVGPDGGDFAGWVLSPNTGYLVDPGTGREFDMVTGRWIDPVTGQPFGEVTQYATRLAGLGGGPGGLVGVGGVGLVPTGAVGGATSGFAGMYGGTVPPSVAAGGAGAQQRMGQQAFRNMAQKAAVANSFAAREAAQGGRPYIPPPGAAAGGAADGRNGSRRNRTRYGGERPGTWRARAADASARHRLAESPGATRGASGASAGGARPVPGPAPASAAARGARQQQGERSRERGDDRREEHGEPPGAGSPSHTRQSGRPPAGGMPRPARGVLGE